ncbi:MAG: dihydrolipoyl dehydrogenase [Sterolibacterium sp.]
MSAAGMYDVAIIGAGPGGYVAGIRAAQLGLTACIVEKDTPGGVCLNWGCIPSKTLIHHAAEYAGLKDLETLGISIDRSGFRYGDVHARSRESAKALAGGVASLLRKNKVEVIKAVGSLIAPGKILLQNGQSPDKQITAKNIIIATGSRPLTVKNFEFDERAVLSSSGILALTELPKRLVILGAGAIGCEFAYVMNAFGVKVTLVEMAGHILPAEDGEIANILAGSMQKHGIEILVNARARSWRRMENGAAVSIDSGGKSVEIKADRILAAFGRSPNTEGIGLERVGIELDARGFIVTRDYCETSRKGIFAIGDVISTPALAHVASKEAEIAVEYIAGHAPANKGIDLSLVPSAVYCEPQVAGFGLREEVAARDKIKFKKSVFPYRGAGKSIAIGKPDGMVKILSDPDTGELLGAQIVGYAATELIHELLLARSGELLAQDVSEMIHAHPTLSEAVMEAARGIFGKPIHS